MLKEQEFPLQGGRGEEGRGMCLGSACTGRQVVWLAREAHGSEGLLQVELGRRTGPGREGPCPPGHSVE